MLKFTVITPCYNAERYIEDTMRSVLNQDAIISGRAALQYIVADGASQDRTTELAEAFNSPHVQVISKQDRGVYDALGNALSHVTGDIVSYLNAGDYYFPWAFDVAAEVFAKNEINWITGLSCMFNDRRQAVGAALPFRYRGRMLQSGLCGRILPFVQQESTFWRSALNKQIDTVKLAGFRLAGDYFLWREFSKTAELVIINSLLGGFRIHGGQLSQQMNDYMKEVSQFTRRPGILDYLCAIYDRALWYAPAKIKKRANPKGILIYDHSLQRWT